MSLHADLCALERLLAQHLVDGDLVCLQRSAQSLAPSLREAVAAIDADGFRIAVLLVMKLRFERLVHGSAIASEWFARDPEGLTSAFSRYHREVPPTAFEAWTEAEIFADWIANDAPPGP
ncbi:MAG: hypothetical protein AB7I19_04120 [Planctomycetota bacterium]